MGDVVSVTGSGIAFAAIKADGSVVTWGGDAGGDSSSVASLLKDVVSVTGSGIAFAAIKADGSVVTWGGDAGGDSSSVASLLKDVVSVTGNGGAFAAIKADGSVVTWGAAECGGNLMSEAHFLSDEVVSICQVHGIPEAMLRDGSVVACDISYSAASLLKSDVTKVYSSGCVGFAAVKADGSIVIWPRQVDGEDEEDAEEEDFEEESDFEEDRES
eukprot:TRINITY_DN6001_c0_g1_i14.p1 TRINITY_DN6001_c0_g1~~TRINITY_DN6001_c0_g1_i14.p1  ORF type:complete len:215 (-),score=62.81 TRINITY_DN6001_c0_g1_i14:78-722(-)